MQRSAAVQERKIREIKSTKRLNVAQCGSARKRNQRNKVNEEAQRGAARQCKKEKSANKVDEDVQCNAARQRKKGKSEK